MKKLALPALAPVLLAFLSQPVFAQTGPYPVADSMSLHAGLFTLKRPFTQTISIKGEDLEKMPFADLSEAIGAWLYGAYSNVYTLSYVVDGIPVTDISGYSVYDIEEVVLVENALVQFNAGPGQTHMVLIRTRKRQNGPLGLRVAVQGGLVNQDFHASPAVSGLKSGTTGYGQFYAGLNRTQKLVDFGLSAGYQRDAQPLQKADSITGGSPYALDRWRLNGYADLRFAKGNDLWIHLNYTTQKIDSSQQYWTPWLSGSTLLHYPYSVDMGQHQSSFSPTATLRSAFGKIFDNELSFAYITAQNRISGAESQGDTILIPGSGENHSTNYQEAHAQNTYFTDRLSADLKAGDWTVTPAVTGYYEHFKGTDSMSNVSNYGYGYQTFGYKGKQYFLGGSLDIAYRRALDLQGGFFSELSKAGLLQPDQDYPFVSLTTDLFQWWNPQSSWSLKLYGSYSHTLGTSTNAYTLPDLNYSGSWASASFINGYGNYYGEIPPGTSFGGIGFVGPNPYPTTYITEGGIGLSTPGHRFRIDYHYEASKFLTPIGIDRGFFGLGLTLYWLGFTAEMHHVDFSAHVLEGKGGVDWQTQLNLTAVRNKYPSNLGVYEQPFTLVGDTGTAKSSWTGGWTNRFRVSGFSVGFDVLVHFNEDTSRYITFHYSQYPLMPRVSSILLQNVYLAYQLPVLKKETPEVYLEGRNLLQSRDNVLGDGRRFFILGGKIGF